MRVMDIVWEEPPKTAKVNGQHAGRYAEFAAMLEERPGEWAKVPLLNGAKSRTESSAAALAQNIRRGKVKGIVAGRFETAFAGTEVWARYIAPTEGLEGQESGAEPSDSAPRNGLAPKIRAWAKRSGIGVPDRGRLPAPLVDAYLQEYPEDRSLLTQA